MIEDGLLTDLSDERVDAVLRPKVAGAVHLHDLTQGLDLRAFVLFSSAAGTLGSAGQGSYAAANAALDALAAKRRSEGLVATSLAWGSWAGVGLAARADSGQQGRLRRGGLVPLDVEVGMRLLDETLTHAEPVLVPIHFDFAAMQRVASENPDAVPTMLRDLVRQRAPRAANAETRVALRRRLASLPEAELSRALLDVVRGELATMLGLGDPARVPADRPLQELGLDSLMAVEARNRLGAVAGKPLPATLLFDHPTPEALAAFLQTVFTARRAPTTSSVNALIDAVRRLERLSREEIERAGLARTLVDLGARLDLRTAENTPVRPSAEEVPDELLIQLIDDELTDQP